MKEFNSNASFLFKNFDINKWALSLQCTQEKVKNYKNRLLFC